MTSAASWRSQLRKDDDLVLDGGDASWRRAMLRMDAGFIFRQLTE
jgi:hypothetical protein